MLSRLTHRLVSRAGCLPGRVFATRRAASLRLFSALSASRPADVGIHSMEAYFPRTAVAQEDLETYDNVGAGKYTLGLGQTRMAFTDDREDINSMALTVVQNLLEKNGISPNDVGRLDVGTETIIDKSKAVKTTLMQLFGDNTNIEGLDTTCACYGGTAALQNAVQWVESSNYDGRWAVVVAGDIAVYEPGPARPTGGAGIFAMLVGPDAVLSMEPGLRWSYMEDAYDFYKPNLESEYPVVDGKLSQVCYTRALDSCYDGYRNRFAELNGGEQFRVTENAAYSLWHSPYTKLVMRSYGRLLYKDFLSNPDDERYASLREFADVPLEESYTHRELTKALDNLCAEGYAKQVGPSLTLSKELGNSYAGSLYGGLLSLVSEVDGNDLVGKRLMMFSYGSGLAATMFSLNVRKDPSEIARVADIKSRLAERVIATPEHFSEALLLREKSHDAADYTPTGVPGSNVDLFPGTYRLDKIDNLKRRSYVRV